MREKKLYTQTEFDAMQETRDSTGYYRGVQETERKHSAIKLQQVQAITKLIEESGRVMSRAGYMLVKLNGDNSR